MTTDELMAVLIGQMHERGDRKFELQISTGLFNENPSAVWVSMTNSDGVKCVNGATTFISNGIGATFREALEALVHSHRKRMEFDVKTYGGMFKR